MQNLNKNGKREDLFFHFAKKCKQYNFHPFSSYVMKDYVHVYYLHVAN